MWHDSFICVTWLSRTCDVTRLWVTEFPPTARRVLYGKDVECDVFTRLMHLCDMTRSYVGHDPFVRVTWLAYESPISRRLWKNLEWYVWYDWCTFVTWLVHMLDMTHSYMWSDSFTSHRVPANCGKQLEWCAWCTFVTCLVVIDMIISFVWNDVSRRHLVPVVWKGNYKRALSLRKRALSLRKRQIREMTHTCVK